MNRSSGCGVTASARPGRTDGRKERRTDGRKDGRRLSFTIPFLFLRKSGGQNHQNFTNIFTMLHHLLIIPCLNPYPPLPNSVYSSRPMFVQSNICLTSWYQVNKQLSIGHVTLVVITSTTILVSYLYIKPLQLMPLDFFYTRSGYLNEFITVTS